MNPTEAALIDRYVDVTVQELAWWQTLLMAWGGLSFLLLVGLVLFAWLDRVEEEAEPASKLDDPDIHPSIRCTCAFLTHLQGGTTGGGTTSVLLRHNPKCPIHGINGPEREGA